jgi:hypothetical protein
VQICFQGQHLKLSLGLGIPLLVLFTLALPTWLYWGILRSKALYGPEAAAVQDSHGLLYKQYKPSFFYWGTFHYGLLLTLSVVAEVLKGDTTATGQTIIYIAVLSVFTVFNLGYYPRSSNLLNILAMVRTPTCSPCSPAAAQSRPAPSDALP